MISAPALIEEHLARYGASPRLFQAPGRINLIGEHTDYNEGFVLPVAIDRYTVAAVSANDADVVRVYSREFEGVATIPIDAPFVRSHEWGDYAGAVVAAVQEEAPLPHGADVFVVSEIPVGAGLSSSAAFELALAQALFAQSGIEPEPRRLAAVGSRAELDYVGIRSGVMDQLASALGEPGMTLLIDCRTLAVEPVALPAGVTIVALDTKVRRGLASSEYNRRHEECERGVDLLRKAGLDIDTLRDVSVEDFERYAKRLPSPERERCCHVIDENQRVLDAVAALAQNDLDRMGELMFASHESLRVLYEVTIPELDQLASIARRIPGVYGARMTGGGFGGCVVALAAEDAIDDIRIAVNDLYYAPRQTPPAMYACRASAGAREIDVVAS